MTAKHAMYVLYIKFIFTLIYATNKCLQRNEGMTGVHSRAPYERKQAVKAEAKHQKKNSALAAMVSAYLPSSRLQSGSQDCSRLWGSPGLLRNFTPQSNLPCLRSDSQPSPQDCSTSQDSRGSNESGVCPHKKEEILSNSREEDSISKERMRNGAM